MDRMVLPLVVLLFCCVFGHPQVREVFYRRTTTPDPVQAFFNNCDPRNANCVRSQDCRQENILTDGRCSTIGQVCCEKEYTPIVFPERSTWRPVITTPKPTSPSPATTVRTTKRTKPKTRTTTTTEAPLSGWLPADCGFWQSNSSQASDLRDAERGEFPWNVGIFSKEENEFGFVQEVFHCGGTLIDNLVVVTSANCENLRSAAKLFISADVKNLDDGAEIRQKRNVTKVIKHPQFAQGTRIASIALLILDDQVDYTQHINRICLPPAQPDVDFGESICFTTGWGGTPDSGLSIRPYMKAIEMQLMKTSECVRAMRRTVSKYVLHNSFQCAQESSRNHICPSDVGSPLFCTIPGRQQQFYFVGVFAWNQFVDRNGACREDNGIVDLFVKVQSFRRWIDEEMEKHERDINIYDPQPEQDDEDEQ